MENFFKNDSSFEVDLVEDYSYFENRTDGNSTSRPITPPKPSTTTPPKSFDWDKAGGAISASAGAISGISSTIQAFKGDGTSLKAQLKSACGRRPILPKKREKSGYNKCVENFNLKKNGEINGNPQNNTPQNDTPPPPADDKNKKIIIGSIIVLALGVTAFVAYKKGWFSSAK